MDLKEWLEWFIGKRSNKGQKIPLNIVLWNAERSIDRYLNERKLRKAIKQIPRIVSTSEGYYIAKTKEEVEASRRPKIKAAISLLAHDKEVVKAYPEFYGTADQLELFVDLEKEEVEWK